MARFKQVFADTWVIGVSYSAPALLDVEDDIICLSSANDTPSVVAFHESEGLTISYNGSPIEPLELAPKAVFIGSVKDGNIVPLYGELKPIPRYPPEETEFHKISWSIPISTGIPDGFDSTTYNKSQRKELKRISEALREARAAKKLSREQEESV